MALYEGREFPFSVQLPAMWELVSDEAEPGKVKVQYKVPGEPTPILLISEIDLNIYDEFPGSFTLDEFVELHIDSALGAGLDPTMLLSERRANAQGVPFQAFVFREGIPGGPFPFTYFVRMIYIHQEEIKFQVEYIVSGDEAYEELWPLFSYSFDTFMVTER